MDAVIPLSKGSNWNDEELKFSLRSLQQYMPEIEKIFVIGHRPAWANKNLLVHAYQDLPGMENKERNICNKILYACKLPELSNEFLFMNDDHFLLSPFTGKNYYATTLEETIINRSSRDHYYHSLYNTWDALKKQRLPGFNFDIHCPIIYDKNWFPEVMDMYNWDVAYGYVIKSLYANHEHKKTFEQYEDLKITSRLSCLQLDETIAERKFFSIGDSAVSVDLGVYLNYLYPNKSKYEL